MENRLDAVIGVTALLALSHKSQDKLLMAITAGV